MQKFLIIFLIIFLLGGIAYWGVKFKFPNFDFSKLNPFKKSDLELTEERLIKRIKLLESKSDSLDPIISRYQTRTDSLIKVDSIIDLKIINLKEKDLQLEKKFTQSKDSLSKYRNILKDAMKKYEELKKNKKTPSNKETIDFFKKY